MKHLLDSLPPEIRASLDAGNIVHAETIDPTAPTPPSTPPQRVSTTAWRVADPGARLTHEFHLALPSKPVHVGLIGASLLAVRIAAEGSEVAETPAFRESSIEETDQGLRIDHDLETDVRGSTPMDNGLRQNLVVFVDFECTRKTKGSVAILLIFESPGKAS